MKIAAVVILYHPNDSFLRNIKSYYDLVSKVYIFDNTENVSPLKDELQQLEKIDYYHDYENGGLPKRLNEGSYKAINDGFDWLLTMDQDSNFLDGSFSKYLVCFNQFINKENVALFGTSNERDIINSTVQCLFEEDYKLMTSGNLINLSLFKKIGEYDEALFIDCVDHDYCIRSFIAGYKSIRFLNIYLAHELGDSVNRASIKTFFLLKKKKEIHSPIRYYYMIRNMLYLTEKFKNNNLAQVKQLKKDVHARVKKGFLYGRNSLLILKYVRLGYKHFKDNKMGKLENI